jgi:hypothetical protein
MIATLIKESIAVAHTGIEAPKYDFKISLSVSWNMLII